MKTFKKVAIVGVGLIGGSIGMALKKKRLARVVVGVSRRRQTLRNALRLHAIDEGAQDIGIIKGADLVIMAAPVKTIITLAPSVRRAAGRECIVTDVGSTKQEVVSALSRLFPRFVGSHPLAGLEKKSVLFASPDMFRGSLCILTPEKSSDKAAVRRVKGLWGCLGARVIFLAPRQHDKVLSYVSHLPHVAAFTLMSTVPAQYLKFASTGMRDTTRIAASDSTLWKDIFLSNRAHLLEAVTAFRRQLMLLESAIRSNKSGRLQGILKNAAAKRMLLE